MPRPSKSGVVRNRQGRKRASKPLVAYPIPLLRTSERGTFKRCRWLWWQEYHETVKPQIDVPPLRFGGLIHECMGLRYKPGIRRGPHPALTFEELYESDLKDAAGQTKNYSQPEIDQIWSEHRDLGYDMLNAWVEKYGKDDEWKVLVTEFPFKTIVPHPRDGVTPWFYYTGILDGVWQSRATGKKLVNDFKTTKSIQLNYLRMDPQATAYWTFGVDALMAHGLLAPDGSEHLDGLLFNFMRKARKDTRPCFDGQYRNNPTKPQYVDALTNKKIPFDPKLKVSDLADLAAKNRIIVIGDVSLKQPSPLHARVPIYRSWYERQGLKLQIGAEFNDMEAVRKAHSAHDDGMPAAYKNPSQFTCNGCWALDICELHEIGQDWTELRQMTTRSWDPYAAHEIREGR